MIDDSISKTLAAMMEVVIGAQGLGIAVAKVIHDKGGLTSLDEWFLKDENYD